MKLRTWLVAMSLAVLSACGTVQPVPEPQYFRMPPAALQALDRAAVSDTAIWVDSFNATSLYAERPVVYAMRPEAVRLRQYHYQYWVDPAPTQLRRRLLDHVRAARLSDTVSERPPEVDNRLRLSGFVTRFERVHQTGGGWVAVVELELKAENTDNGALLVRQQLTESEPANGDRMEATVAAFTIASDRAIGRFVASLGEALAKDGG
jgi:ABC-type uncharacterized transport system auxiliary subunit